MSDKILSFYKEAKQLIQRKMVVPRMVSVWLSHRCNLNCSYCGFSSTHDGTSIDGVNFKLLLEDLASLGVEGIEFSGGGEPTLHEQCFEFAEVIRDLGMSVGILTNGYRFDFERIKHFDYVRIGLDAKDSKEYSKVKGVKEEVFDRVVENIKQIIYRRNEDIMVKPIVGVKFIINENNYKEMADFVSYARHLGTDYVSFRKLFITKDSEINDEAESYFDNVKKVWNDYIQGSFSFSDLIYPCFMAPIHAVIMADGSLLNCCYFNDKEHIIGNVFEKPFKKLWYSERHWKILESISPYKCNKWTCRFRNYNNRMQSVLDGEEFISFI